MAKISHTKIKQPSFGYKNLFKKFPKYEELHNNAYA
jgi:hypothetical protein